MDKEEEDYQLRRRLLRARETTLRMKSLASLHVPPSRSQGGLEEAGVYVSLGLDCREKQGTPEFEAEGKYSIREAMSYGHGGNRCRPLFRN